MQSTADSRLNHVNLRNAGSPDPSVAALVRGSRPAPLSSRRRRGPITTGLSIGAQAEPILATTPLRGYGSRIACCERLLEKEGAGGTSWSAVRE